MGKVNTNSNLYIVIYSTVMVIIVATLLAVASMSLKELQNNNKLGEKKQSILTALFAAEAAAAGQADVNAYMEEKGVTYDSYIKGMIVENGVATEAEDAQALFASLDKLDEAFAAGRLPLFEAEDGRVVIPVTGSGLWGPIWGYVAFNDDLSTVAGIVLAHQGETPGLGAEMATAKYQAKFVGKQIFDGDEFKSITLVKGGAKDPVYEVDAITGGTKTSDGITAMLRSSLEQYLPYLQARRAAVTASEEAAASEEENGEENAEVSNE